MWMWAGWKLKKALRHYWNDRDLEAVVQTDWGKEPLLNRCQTADYHCENYPGGGCGTCRELCRIQEILNAELRRTPLSELF